MRFKYSFPCHFYVYATVCMLLGFEGEVMHLISLVSVLGQKAGQEGSREMRVGVGWG